MSKGKYTTSFMAATKPKVFYAVRRGRNPGIYTTWNDCRTQVHQWPRNYYKSFETHKEATAFMQERSQSKNADIRNQESKLDSKWAHHIRKKTSPTASPSNSPARKKHKPRVARSFFTSSSAKAQRTVFPVVRRRVQAVDVSVKVSYKDVLEGTHCAADLHKPKQMYNGPSQHFDYVPSGPVPRLFPKPTFDPEFHQPEPGSFYIDGSYYNAGVNGRAGIGVFFGPHCKYNVAERLSGIQQSSCRAEIAACIKALRVTQAPIVNATDCDLATLMQRCKEAEEFVDVFRNPTIYTDCKYLVDAESKYMTEWISTGLTKSGRRPKNLDLLVDLSELTRNRKITWKLVSSHSGDPGNDAADLLAKAGAKEDNMQFLDTID
jgi:ribonuclease HI